MRLAIRLKCNSFKSDTQIQKTSSNVSNMLPIFQDKNANQTFQFNYLLNLNKKIIHGKFYPKQDQTQQLIKEVSKLIGIAEEYLIIKVINKWQNNKQQQEKINHSEKDNLIKKQSKNNTGVKFSDTYIKKIRIVRGFPLSAYAIIINNENSPQIKVQKSVQLEVEILPNYYGSEEYIQKINQIKIMQSIRSEQKVVANKVVNTNIEDVIKQEDEQDDQQSSQPQQKQEDKFITYDNYHIVEDKQRKTYDPSISIYRGQCVRIRKPPLKNHMFYYVFDPYQGMFMQFQNRQKYPNKPHEMLSLNLLKGDTFVKRLAPKQLSWYMNKQLHYFVLQLSGKKKQTYKLACHFSHTADIWVQAIKKTVQKWNQIKVNPQILNDLVRNQKSILDRIQMSFKKSESKSNKKYVKAFESICDLKSSQSQCMSPTKVSEYTEDSIKKNQPKTSSESLSQKRKQQDQHFQDVNNKSLQLKHFKLLRQLGQGSFGQVFLAFCLKNKKQYALKVFKKKKLVLQKQIKFAIAEINILKQLDHPFLITLHFTFQTPNYIYLGLQYCSGKDLSQHLLEQINFKEQEVRLYAAELVLALEYLHGADIIYRDLKPENILLSHDGHLKIIDFGLSKQSENNYAKSFCGSPAYISPQMLKKNGVGKQCDFFSLGAVIYQMLVGQPPFYSQNINQLYQNIANAKLKFPKLLSQNAKSLLDGLLKKDPKSRLGSGGFSQIKNHIFFKDIDWDKVLNKQYQSPLRVLTKQKENKEEDQIQNELMKFMHQDFDYSEHNIRINRFKNFSFIRDGQFGPSESQTKVVVQSQCQQKSQEIDQDQPHLNKNFQMKVEGKVLQNY